MSTDREQMSPHWKRKIDQARLMAMAASRVAMAAMADHEEEEGLREIEALTTAVAEMLTESGGEGEPV